MSRVLLPIPHASPSLSLLKDASGQLGGIRSGNNLRNLLKMRAAVFAIYPHTGVVGDYVLRYIRHLQEVADYLVVVADFDLSDSDIDRLERSGITKLLYGRHGKYDFGSYQIGINYLRNKSCLDQCSELILCNDSCYGPIDNFYGMLSSMSSMDCDFAGLTDSPQLRYHLQSYFLLFKKNVFLSETFSVFFSNVKEQKKVSLVVKKYEVGLTQALLNANFKPGALIHYKKISNDSDINPTFYPLQLIKQGSELIKVKTFSDYICLDVLRDNPYAVLKEVGFRNKNLLLVILEDLSMRPISDCQNHTVIMSVKEIVNKVRRSFIKIANKFKRDGIY